MLAAFIMAMLLQGCGSSPTGAVGHWVLSIDKSQLNGLDKTSPKAQEYLKMISLDFRKDDTFTLTFGVPITGTYDVHGSRITLHGTGFGGTHVSASKGPVDTVGTMDGDGFSLPMQDNTLVFIKQGPPNPTS